jgi:hypothetical protein
MKKKNNAFDINSEAFKKLDKHFPGVDHWLITATALTCAEAIGEDYMEAFEAHQMSAKAKYAIIQYHSLKCLIYSILRGEVDLKKGLTIEHMPQFDWESDDSWEARFIKVTKGFYEHLKKEGKI